jgi:tetratricopeptide (TPR) repeat protein
MVILDNLETVEDAQAAVEFLGELSCAVLITCRVRPAGGEVIELAPLSSEAALRLFQSVSALETQELDQAASDLCALDLEGHPLAIEVVGALVAAGLDAAEVRGYLQEMPLDVLSETASGAGRSVVDTLQLSYQRLSPLAQTLLARMSIFPAGFDLAALAALSPEHSRLHQVKGLRQLLERSLLVQVSRQHYRLHPVIRQFAYTLLDEPAPFHRRASAHFMTAAGHDSLAATEQLFLAGDVGQAAALVPAHVEEWISAGRASRASRQLARFDEHTVSRSAWLALCQAQGDLLAFLGQTEAAMVAYRRVLDGAGPPGQRARVECKIGELVRRQQPAEAITWFEQALAHLDAPESLEAARIYIRMSMAWFRQGEYGQACTWAQKGLGIARQLDASVEIAEADVNLGNVYAVQGAYERAIEVYREALSILQGAEHKRPVTEAAVQSSLASLYHYRGDWEQAIAYHQQSLRTEEMLGNADGIAVTCFNLGHVYTLRGDFERAGENLDRCLALWERAGSDYGVAAAWMNTGLLRLKRGELRGAEAALARSQTAFEAVGSDDFMSEVYRLMSEVALAQDRPALAIERARRSLALAQQLGVPLEEGATWRELGVALAAQGQEEEALQALQRSLALLTELESLYEVARTRLELGLLHLRSGAGDQAQAMTGLRLAKETFDRLGAAPDVAVARTALEQAQLPDLIDTTIE